MTLDLARPILAYIRAYYIEAPQSAQRYFQLFGELDYELKSVRTERHIMSLRLEEIQRLVERGVAVNERILQSALLTARKRSNDKLDSLARLRKRINASGQFQFDPNVEKESFYLLADITGAIMGMGDSDLRKREQETFTMACEAYGRLDTPELTDIHESVQGFLSLPRREYLEEEEAVVWSAKLARLYRAYPLNRAEFMASEERIAEKIITTQRRIAREQTALERMAMACIAALRSNRNRN